MLFSVLATAAFAAGSLAAPVEPRYKQDILEDYDTYHVRYLALNCHQQHNTTFFTECCRPLNVAKNQTLEDRPAYCTPNATVLESASSVIAEATTTVSATDAWATGAPANGTDDADEEWCSEAVEASAIPSPTEDAVAAETPAAETPAAETPAAETPAAEPTPAAESPVVVAAAAAAPTESTTTEAASAPAPTEDAAVEAAPSPSAAPSSSEAAPAEPSSSPAASQGNGQTYSDAFATFYMQNGVAGACGDVASDSDYVVAIDTAGWWQDTSRVSDLCGKRVSIRRTDNGASVTATIKDACPTCETRNSLDLSKGAFLAIATESEGMVPIEWNFV